jgi:hypothetical protein
MSEQQLLDMIDYASSFAEKLFAAKGEIRPRYHAVTANEEVLVVPAPSRDKDTGVAMVRALFIDRHVVRYVFLDEAWMLGRTEVAIDDDEMARIMRDGLTNHPNRIEVVMFSGEDAECGMAMARRLIVRPENGKPYLGPFEWTLPLRPGRNIHHLEGRMVGLLPPRGPQQ